MNEGKVAKVLAAYKEHLRKAHGNDKTGKYHWPITQIDKIVNSVRIQIVTHGIRSVDIKTTAWKATAKQFGIANTHSAWDGALA